jgi:hypothetical protein
MMSFVCVSALALFLGCSTEPAEPVRVAYVYNSNTDLANTFQTLLEGNSYAVDLITMAQVEATDFSVYEAILISHGSDVSLDWGAVGQVSQITSAGGPVMGLGRGGAVFLETAYASEIGLGNTMTISCSSVDVIPGTVWSTPNTIDVSSGNVQVYGEDCTTSVAVYLSPIPADITCIGSWPDNSFYYPIATEEATKYLWGFSGVNSSGVVSMTPDGESLFLNLMYDMTH